MCHAASGLLFAVEGAGRRCAWRGEFFLRSADLLKRMDGTDFQKEMNVAVLWGEMNFSRGDEKCWIEEVAILKDEVVVDCRAMLWGGAVDASFGAWPYHVKVVPRSPLPVRFKQTTVWTAPPGCTDKDKTVETMRDGEWKHEFPPKK